MPLAHGQPCLQGVQHQLPYGPRLPAVLSFLFRSRGIEKKPLCFFAVPEEVLRSPSDNHAVPSGSSLRDHALGNTHDSICIESLDWSVWAAFVTAHGKGLQQPIIKRIGTLLTP